MQSQVTFYLWGIFFSPKESKVKDNQNQFANRVSAVSFYNIQYIWYVDLAVKWGLSIQSVLSKLNIIQICQNFKVSSEDLMLNMDYNMLWNMRLISKIDKYKIWFSIRNESLFLRWICPSLISVSPLCYLVK